MRKHLVFGVIFLLNTMGVIMAQDVIFRSSSDSIQAQVLTVGITEISYRKWSNLDGPVYFISINEVVAIRYANGTYDFFTNKNVSKPEKSNQNRSVILTRDGNTYYYGNRVMDKKATLEWLKTQHCHAAYEQFDRGLYLSNVGWFMMGVGLGVDLVGNILLFVNTQSKTIGSVLICIGSAFEIACIPTIAVGYSKMHQTVNVYNVSCGSTAQIKPYWSVQASNNGIGLAYHF